MVSTIVSTVASSLSGFGGWKVENFIDRLNRYYSSIFFLFLACLVSSKQLVGNPIECWCPAQFTDNQVRYANSYCWVSSTHYLSKEHAVIPRSFSKDYSIAYYQWVPLMFLLQCFLCHIPYFLWRFLLQQNGANASGLLEAAFMAIETNQLEMRKKAIEHIAYQLDRYTSTRRHSDSSCYTRVMNVLSRKFFLFGGKNYGNFLANSYIFIKAVYICNSVLQIHLLDMLLGEERSYHLYGIKAIHGMILKMPWTDPEHFPTGTLCELEIRDQSRIHNYVVQCVLSINIFNEKIFVFLWFWFFVLITITSLDLIIWFIHNFYWEGATNFVSKRLLRRIGTKPHLDPVLLSRFVRSYLRRDGMVILRLIGCNCGDVLISDILDQLWFCYMPRPSDKNYVNIRPGFKTKETSISLRESSSTVQLV